MNNKPLLGLDEKYSRVYAAYFEILERMIKSYDKQPFGIVKTKIDQKDIGITEKIVVSKPFCNVIHFAKKTKVDLPKLLIVAPMAGHNATLLRNTVEECLPYFDVYITDWKDAKYIPEVEGKFDLEAFIEYTIEFLEKLSPDLHVMAVCQPTVPLLAAVALMSEKKSFKVPESMILIGGPVDSSKSPTKLNLFTLERPISWFESSVISKVPYNYPGLLRDVYPGFLQLSGFMMLNIDRHINSHIDLFKAIKDGDEAAADKIRKFYDEYFCVMDLTSEFFLQTVKVVFQDRDLPRGKMKWRGKVVDTKYITDTALFGIEGELDDIAGIGQTKAALDLCSNIPAKKKRYHLQKGVGHYGVFSGSKFRKFVLPEIIKFIEECGKSNN